MLDKLREVEKRFEQLNERLCDSDIASDIEEYKKIMQELKTLTPVVEKFREYKKIEASMQEAKELLDAGGLEPDFKEMVREEFESAKEELEVCAEELKVLLLPRDPNDDRNVVVEIRAGAGGEEASLFAGGLFRMYSMYAQARGWKCEIVNENATELGGYKEVSFMIEGEGAYSRLKFE
ncbi:MAG: PCRF domain-containing protein, partial [Clostridia bacterium]|nr:PCRF domain-containing protein [Clostridia bacterium]